MTNLKHLNTLVKRKNDKIAAMKRSAISTFSEGQTELSIACSQLGFPVLKMSKPTPTNSATIAMAPISNRSEV